MEENQENLLHFSLFHKIAKIHTVTSETVTPSNRVGEQSKIRKTYSTFQIAVYATVFMTCTQKVFILPVLWIQGVLNRSKAGSY
jgi:hypothetical protein